MLGGDGTILRALRRYAGTSVPVFAVNYGEVGFLATSTPRTTTTTSRARSSARWPATSRSSRCRRSRWRRPTAPQAAINDVSIHRRGGKRVAELSYAVDGEEVGSVRCDGLVIATPAGSTGYNLANGGPVLAWGVEGFVVSFIAPHSLTARALVVAPGDLLSVHNRSQDDGRRSRSTAGRRGELDPGEAIAASLPARGRRPGPGARARRSTAGCARSSGG